VANITEGRKQQVGGIMTVPRFKAGDIINYPYQNGYGSYFLVTSVDPKKYKIYSLLVIYENSPFYKDRRAGTVLEMNIDTMDRFCTVEA
jgi:hypothetical protein